MTAGSPCYARFPVEMINPFLDVQIVNFGYSSLVYFFTPEP
jgi:hypothetical protein